MRKYLLTLLIPWALLAQTSVQKNSSGVVSNGPVQFGAGNTLSAVTGATVNFTGATQIGIVAGATPYTGITGVPTVSLLGNATGGAANAEAITLAGDLKFTGTVLDTIQPILTGSSPTFAGLTLNGHGVSLGGALTTANALTTVGNFAVTLNFTGATNVIFPTSGTLLTSAALNYFTPEQFGMVGDGVTDDFPAWKTLVAAVNSAGGGTIIFAPHKTYFFGQHITAINGVTNAVFTGLSGLAIWGNGSTILVQGGFNRDVTTTATLGGLLFQTCSNITVEDLTLNGNNATVTRAGGVGESPFSYGFICAACQGVSVTNVVSTNWCTDSYGFVVGNGASNPFIACKNVTLTNCQGIYSARQGLTVAQLRGGMFINCNFSNTGKESGSYGVHAPGNGTDVEPDNSTTSTPPNQMDVNTGNLHFINCTMVNNSGQSFGAGYNAVSDSVHIDGGTYDSSVTSNSIGFGISVPNSSIAHALINLGNSVMGVDPVTSGSPADVDVTDNTIMGNRNLITSTENPALNIQRNRFISTAPVPWNQAFITITGATVCNFSDNYVYIPQEAFTDDHNYQLATNMTYAVGSGNTFQTNLPPSADAGNQAHFYAGIATQYNNVFIGTRVGQSDTFRPYLNANWNTTYPFSTGPLDALTNGQVLIGITGNPPAAAAINSTNGGVLVQNGSGSITMALQSSIYGPTSVGVNTGTTPAATVLQVVDTGTASPRGITDDQYNAGTNSAQFNARKARGTFASPTTIVTGDILSRFLAWGYDGTNFIESGNLRFTSSGTIATGQVPSQAEIWTSTNANPSVLTKAVTWDSGQNETVVGRIAASNLSLGGNLTTANALTVSGNFATTVTVTGSTSVTLPTSGTLATTAATVASITGTGNQITASASTGAVTLSIPSTLIAPGSIQATTTLAGVTENLSGTTSASSAITGTLTVGNGTAATNVGIGGGNVNAGGIGTFSSAQIAAVPFSPSTNARLSVSADVSPGSSLQGQIATAGATDPRKATVMGYDTTNNFGFLYSGINTVSYSPLVLQPSPSTENVYIGANTNHNGEKLQVTGGLYASGVIAATNTTTSSSNSTGAVVIGNGSAGGLGVGGAIFTGGAITAGGAVNAGSTLNALLTGLTGTNVQAITAYQAGLVGSPGPSIIVGVAASTNNSGGLQFHYDGGAGSSSNYFSISLYGQSGITVDGNGNGTIAGNFALSGSKVLTTPNITMGSGTGSVTATSGVFSVTSDRRAKNDHGDFNDGLEAIRNLHPVVYDFKNDNRHTLRAGFYTQDVESFVHHAVFHDSTDGMASLDDRPILAAAVNAIKELDHRPEKSLPDWPARGLGAAALIVAVAAYRRNGKYYR